MDKAPQRTLPRVALSAMEKAAAALSHEAAPWVRESTDKNGDTYPASSPSTLRNSSKSSRGDQTRTHASTSPPSSSFGNPLEGYHPHLVPIGSPDNISDVNDHSRPGTSSTPGSSGTKHSRPPTVCFWNVGDAAPSGSPQGSGVTSPLRFHSPSYFDSVTNTAKPMARSGSRHGVRPKPSSNIPFKGREID